jgi:hypothetical protein
MKISGNLLSLAAFAGLSIVSAVNVPRGKFAWSRIENTPSI